MPLAQVKQGKTEPSSRGSSILQWLMHATKRKNYKIILSYFTLLPYRRFIILKFGMKKAVYLHGIITANESAMNRLVVWGYMGGQWRCIMSEKKMCSEGEKFNPQNYFFNLNSSLL